MVVLVAVLAVLFLHLFRMQVAAHGVVPAEAVLDDGGEHPAHVRVQTVAAGELEGVLPLEAVRGVVALQLFLRVVEQHAHVGAAFHVGETQGGAAPHPEGPVRAARQRVLVERGLHGVLLVLWLRGRYQAPSTRAVESTLWVIDCRVPLSLLPTGRS